MRVHPELLAKQKLPPKRVNDRLWERRYQDIRCFERYLARNGTVVRKFFLHVSRGEQRKRFLERLEDPAKHWKFSAADLAERDRWKDYMDAYEKMIRATASKHAPWYVIPADNKWYTRIVVAAVMVDTLESLELGYPEIAKSERAVLEKAKRALEAEK